MNRDGPTLAPLPATRAIVAIVATVATVATVLLVVPAGAAARRAVAMTEGKLMSWFVVRPLNYAFSRGGEAGTNPGNNLHVSGLSSRVDTRDLEQAFAKVGRVRFMRHSA